MLIVTAGSLIAGGSISEFHATKEDGAVLLEWATISENGLSHFRIERKADQSRWKKIDDVRAKGQSSSRQTYEFLDSSIFKASEANFTYRLVMVDTNGTETIYNTTASASAAHWHRPRVCGKAPPTR